jgi:thiamine-phosphate pyrophosphorylase
MDESRQKLKINKKSILRIIDANLNRCREGLRVVEDGLRFILKDEVFYKKARSIRHKVDKILRNKYGKLLNERDSIKDFGRQLPETNLKRLPAIIIANFKRLEEALRVLEEYTKVIASEASVDFKKQRYLAYTLEKNIYLRYKSFFDKNNK